MEKSIHYFENPGEENTDKVIELVKERKEELGIDYIVIASATGRSAVKLGEKISDAHIVNVTHHAGFRGEDGLEVTSENGKNWKIWVSLHTPVLTPSAGWVEVSATNLRE